MAPEGSSNEAVSGSFRDRESRVYQAEGRIFRGLSASATAAFEALVKKKFYSKFVEQKRLVDSKSVDKSDLPLSDSTKQQWSSFIEHSVIPVISYPYEWTFGMLRDAALLQLDLTEAAIREDIDLKDATPYNVQFVDGCPVFIDVGSFQKRRKVDPWLGYRQFCEMFLFPLMLQAYKGMDFQLLMRGRMDGIAVADAARLFGFSDRFRKGVISHIWLQSKLEKRYGGEAIDMRSELKTAGFNKELIFANLKKLRKLVSGLTWNGRGSEWGEYEEFHNYSDRDAQLKEEFVEKSVIESKAETVWDIGCNTGRFSQIAARHAKTVLAMDQDHFAVERLYRELSEKDESSILTLVQDISDPSPNWGWRNRERSELVERARPDLVLCLALIHHVVITAHIPLHEFIDWLVTITDQVVIEFVAREDDKVQALLRNKDNDYADYDRDQLEVALARHFPTITQTELESGNRFLYWCRA